MAIVIDASVALKWVLKEDDSEQARALAASETMIAPDFWLVECANVLAMRVRRGNITIDGADQALDVILSAPVNVVPARAYIASAQALAIGLNKSAYDCLYLAVAINERAPMVTSDAAFFRAASTSVIHAPFIRML